MASEMPFINGWLARLNDAERMIAAFGIVAVISITIESPVIALLPTSTTLSRTRQSYCQVRRFTLHLMAGTTLLHFLMGWTPLFDLVIKQWMQVPESLIASTRAGMKIMLLWSAAIAYRRFKQGVLIRYGEAHYVSKGSMLRLFVSAGAATLLAVSTGLPGIVVATLALSCGVVAEAGYAHWAARKIIAKNFDPDVPSPDEPELSYRDLVKFHWPLAASNLLFLLTSPLIAASLARSPNPEFSLAAWPILSGLLFFSRAPVVALPEVIIALDQEMGSRKALKNFSLAIGIISSLALAVVSYTPLAEFYFQTMINVSAELAAIATLGGKIGLLIPISMAGVSLYRGWMAAHRMTMPVSIGMAVDLIVMAAALYLGVVWKFPGIPTAVAAITLALTAEVGVLMLAAKRVRLFQ